MDLDLGAHQHQQPTPLSSTNTNMQIQNTVRPNTNTHAQIHTKLGAGCGYNDKCSCGPSTPSTTSTSPPMINALKDDVLLKPIIAPTIAGNISMMHLSYPHFSRLDTLTDVSKKQSKFVTDFRGTPILQTNVFSMKGVADVLHLCTSTIDYMSSFYCIQV